MTITTSMIIGKMLKVTILSTLSKPYEPRETILIIFPVSRLRWYAKDSL